MSTEPQKKQRVLLTGGSGFIGGYFQKKYADVYDIVPLSLRQDFSLSSFVAVDTVVHLAALVHQMQGAPEEQYFTINFDTTKKLATLAKEAGVGHFIFMSTAHVYGVYGELKNHEQRLTETTPCNPHDPYGQSKIKAEEFLLSIQDDKFKVSLVRSPLVYGPGGKGNLNALDKLIRISPLLPFNFDKNARSLIFVGNLCYFLHLTIQKKVTGVLLPQDREPVSIKRLVISIAKARSKKIALIQWPKPLFSLLCRVRPNIMTRLYGTLALDSTNTNQRLGYTAPVTTEDALKETFKS